MLATPNTATLSVMRTFMSAPSRDFTVSRGPSTASMVPRIRTVGGCWAHATDPSMDRAVSEATSTRGINAEIFGMAVSSQGLFRQRAKHRSSEAIPRSVAPPSHRRRQPVAADGDAVGFERTVRQLFHEGDHLGAGLQLGFVGGNIGHNRRIGRDHDFLLAVLVFDGENVSLI